MFSDVYGIYNNLYQCIRGVQYLSKWWGMYNHYQYYQVCTATFISAIGGVQQPFAMLSGVCNAFYKYYQGWPILFVNPIRLADHSCQYYNGQWLLSILWWVINRFYQSYQGWTLTFISIIMGEHHFYLYYQG